LQSEYFQDDLFPPTLQSWIPSVDASDWIDGVNKEQPFVSLKPDGMFSREYCKYFPVFILLDYSQLPLSAHFFSLHVFF
jgi:hypothetical protein